MEQPEKPLKEGQYLSIASLTDYENTIKRSRFIASLRIVENRNEFDAAIKDIFVLYPKATHYCWAYRFFTAPVLEHSSDAGEPAGSAGRPILGKLKKHSLFNIMAVVTRYYGGVKLGIPGLISAYGETAAQAILKAEIIIREPMTFLSFDCSYELYNLILDVLKRHRVSPDDGQILFNESISGEIKIPLSALSSITAEFSQMRHHGYLEYHENKIS